MNEQAKAQTLSFLRDTQKKMKIKLAEAETANIKSSDDIVTFKAVIQSIDLALERFKDE